MLPWNTDRLINRLLQVTIFRRFFQLVLFHFLPLVSFYWRECHHACWFTPQPRIWYANNIILPSNPAWLIVTSLWRHIFLQVSAKLQAFHVASCAPVLLPLQRTMMMTSALERTNQLKPCSRSVTTKETKRRPSSPFFFQAFLKHELEPFPRNCR